LETVSFFLSVLSFLFFFQGHLSTKLLPALVFFFICYFSSSFLSIAILC
jgi:hypothetical protein